MSNDATTFLILRLVNSRVFKLSLFSRCFFLVFRVENDQLLFWRFSFLLLLFFLFFFCMPACASLPDRATILAVFCFFFFVHPVGNAWHRAAFSFLYLGVLSLSLVHMPRRGGCSLYNSGKCKFQESPDEHNGFRKRILRKKKRGCWDAKLSYVGRGKQQCGSLFLFFLVVGIGKAWRDRRLAHVSHAPFFFLSPLTVFSWMPASFFFSFALGCLFFVWLVSLHEKKKLQHTLFFFSFSFSFSKLKGLFFFWFSTPPSASKVVVFCQTFWPPFYNWRLYLSFYSTRTFFKYGLEEEKRRGMKKEEKEKKKYLRFLHFYVCLSLFQHKLTFSFILESWKVKGADQLFLFIFVFTHCLP